MKKTYIKPTMVVIETYMRNTLLSASSFTTEVNLSDGDSGSESYARDGGLFDDDED